MNSASKLLLFTHAFESLVADRLKLETDARDARSRAGIAAVGASFKEVLRNWQPSSVAGRKTALATPRCIRSSMKSGPQFANA